MFCDYVGGVFINRGLASSSGLDPRAVEGKTNCNIKGLWDFTKQELLKRKPILGVGVFPY